MKKFLTIIAAAVIGLASYHPASARPDHVEPVERYMIQNDPGGSVIEFQKNLKYMSDNQMHVALSGYCASACTLLLSTDYKLDVCISPDVKIGFHQPYAMDGLGRIHRTIQLVVQVEKMWKEDFYKKYPQWVKTKIDLNGGVPAVNKGAKPSDLLWMTYEDLKPFMRTCL